MQKYIKLNLFYLGKSKKHLIFRAKKWEKKYEKISNKAVFTEQFEEIGVIKEIFGPINAPFVSIKAISNTDFNPNDNLYIKMR